MPLFISDEELRLLAGDAAAVAERADAAIRELRRQVDTVRAEADAAAISAEQTCALLEQRFAALSAEFDRSQAEVAEMAAASERRAAELAASQAEIHQLHLQAIAKDGDIERLKAEVSELQKSKRQSLEVIEQRDVEIREKDATIQSFLEKTVNLADAAAGKEARIHEVEVKLTHCQATCNRITQEKELLEKHNLWLDEELKAKIKSLAELRKANMDEEAKMSVKITELERQISESSSSLRRSKERISELEQRISYLEKELCSTKDAAASNEQHLHAELSTVMKLAELHKESSEEWSKKAGELEGVIKALETHLTQVDDQYKEKLEKETSARKELEKEATDLRQKLEKCESELENARKSSQLSLIPLASFPEDPAYLADTPMKESSLSDTDGYRVDQNDQMIVPKVPAGVSGTALAASLLRDGWSLAKMYEKYQEATDALRHERWGRRHAEAVLERVLHEIEEKAELILDERAEHDRMVEAYALMDQKLQQALMEHDNFENTIRKLKSELRKRERDHSIAQKEIDDLQKQVAVLLKECQDIQLRCGSSPSNLGHGSLSASLHNVVSNVENDIHEHMSFKDINGLVQQNVQLRNQVDMLTSDLEKRDMELRESFQIELQKVTDDAAARVERVMKKSEEQGIMIESLHRSVAMYRKLCEEQQKNRSNGEAISNTLQDDGKKDLMLLYEGSQEISKKGYEQVAERARNLEEELTKLRSELVSLRSGRDKAVLEADFARDRLNGFMVELEHQRKEANSISARNVELMHLLVDYQKRLRESADSMQAFEENSRKLSMEVSILKNEKEILVKSEKRALDEVHNLTERVHRLQATLDTIHTTEEVQENARAVERRNQEEHIKRLERDWAELKKELQEQRDHVRVLELDKKNAFDGCMKQVEDMRKELSISWKAVSDAESRAAVAEANFSDLEARLKGRKIILKNNGRDSSTSSTEANEELFQLREELQKYKEEAEANKNYMLQYKEIAHSNEVALKQMESAHQDYKTESDLAKKTLEEDILNLRSKLSEVEKNYVMKCEEASTVIEAKEKDISSLMNEISVLRKEVSEKVAQIETLEIQLASSKSALDEQYIRWRSAQDNYERQVILQSETIQELTSTSKQLSSLQQEIAELRQTAEAQKAENDALRTFVEQEKIELLKAKDEAQRKYNELNEQNKILHNQLEVLHIRLAEKERSIAGFSSQHADSQREDDLHSVISYLRRSKEIAETEISLLKQEKSRLQIELESALKSAKEAQDLIRNQAESSRTLMFKDEEFKSLQLQVREINLLRESNIQLRGENKHNFEECQKLRDEVQNVKKEAERLHNLLLEKQVEAEMHQKELEMQKNEIANLNHRIVELVENSKGIDLNEYETMKAELQNTKSILRENGVELEQAKSLLLERELVIRNLEEKLARCQSELDAWESKLNDVETSMKSEIDKQKKVYFSLKRKHEILMKEKEDVVKDNHGLLKQTEDLKSIQKATSEIALEQAVKEKDFRIQTLEKTLEKERDDNKKEKVYRKKAEKVFTAAIQNVSKEKKQVEEAIEKHRQAVKEVFERSGIAPSQIPSGSALDEQAVSYFFTAKQMEDSSSPFHDGATSQFPPVETPTTDASAAAAGRQVATPARPAQAKAVEERAATALSKPNPEVRRPGGRRPLVRPTLERTEEPQVDADISVAEGSMAVQEEKGSSSLERENSGGVSSLQSSTRKRLISFLQTREDASQAEHGNDATPALKKPKEEHLQGTSELKSVQSPTEDVVMAQVPVLPSTESTDAQQPIEEMDTDQAMVPSEEVDATKEEDVGYKDETEEQTDALLETRSHETEVLSDNDAATLEEIPDKSGAVVESIDDEQKIEDVKKETPVDGEDEREEGELMPEEPEQQQDGTTMGETHQEPTPTDVGEQTGDSLRAASPGGLTEKSDADTSEETGEGDTTTDGAAVEPDQSPQVPFGGPEGSPSTQPEAASPTRDASSSLVPASTSSEQQNLSTVTEAVETRTRRTINLSERAQQNRVARLAQASQQASRGRGRPSLRKDGARGLRGRGGRGQT